MFLSVSTSINKCPTANMFDMIRVASASWICPWCYSVLYQFR